MFTNVIDGFSVFLTLTNHKNNLLKRNPLKDPHGSNTLDNEPAQYHLTVVHKLLFQSVDLLNLFNENLISKNATTAPSLKRCPMVQLFRLSLIIPKLYNQ